MAEPTMTETSTFTPQLSKAEAFQLARQHKTSCEGKKALEAGAALKRGDYAVEHLRAIYGWKTRNRGKLRLDCARPWSIAKYRGERPDAPIGVRVKKQHHRALLEPSRP
jgi:hypothetical protein